MTLAKVLMVDDEVPFVEAMTRRLTRRKLEIIPAFNGKEALAQLTRHPQIDVVILDVKMPGMNGLETLAAIKKAYPTKEVLMLTGHATMESAIEGLNKGAFDYLMKPCDIDLLVKKVTEAAARKRRLEEQPDSSPETRQPASRSSPSDT